MGKNATWSKYAHIFDLIKVFMVFFLRKKDIEHMPYCLSKITHQCILCCEWIV